MKRSIAISIVSALMFGLIGSVQAEYGQGTRDPGVNARQHHQHKRIRQGVRSGELTREETRALHQQQKQIRTQEQAYKSDGDLTYTERKDLHQDLNQARRNIYQEKHDDEVRPKARP